MSKGLWRVEHFEEIDSTNTYLSVRAREGADEGLVAYTDFQSAGRGRLGRAWEAPSRSALLVSILLRPAQTNLQWSTVAVALSARAAVISVAGVAPELKWPNDLLVNGRKLAGVLSEFVDHPTPAVVVGMGLNLTASMPERGTDLLAETGHSISAGSILDALLKELDERRPLLDSVSGLTALRSEYLATLSTLGQLVRVERHDGDLIGRAVGIGDAGELLIDSDGVEHAISLGDVIHLRAVQP